MKLENSLLVLIFPVLWYLLNLVAPSLPPVFTEPVFVALVGYILAKLGVVVAEPAVRGFFIQRGLRGFIRASG